MERDGNPPEVCFLSAGLTCTEQNFITKAGSQLAAAEHGIIIVAPDTSPRKTTLATHSKAHHSGLESESVEQSDGVPAFLPQVAATSKVKMRAGTLGQELVSMSTPPRIPGKPTIACTRMSQRRCSGFLPPSYHQTLTSSSSCRLNQHPCSVSAPEAHQRELLHRPGQDVHQRALHGWPRGAHLRPEESGKIQGNFLFLLRQEVGLRLLFDVDSS